MGGRARVSQHPVLEAGPPSRLIKTLSRSSGMAVVS